MKQIKEVLFVWLQPLPPNTEILYNDKF